MEKVKKLLSRKLLTAAIAAIIFTLVLAAFTACTPSANPGDGGIAVEPPEVKPQVYSVTMTYNDAPVAGLLSADIMVGTITVGATVNKDADATGTLAFTSSDKSVATVTDDGHVTLVGVGETVLTVTYADKSFSTVLRVSDGTVGKYAVTVNGGTPDSTRAAAGEIVTLTPDIPEHKQFVRWIFSESDTAIEWINGNTFKMPAGDVVIGAEYVDMLYTLRLVGATVTASEKADGGALEADGKAAGYDGDTHTDEYAITEYKFPYAAKLTLTAKDAPAGKMLVGWDENSINNRRNDDKIIEDFVMPDETSTIWAVFSEIHSTDIFWKTEDGVRVPTDGIFGWGDAVTRIDGSAEGADPDLMGYSGFKIKIDKDKVRQDYNEDITGSEFESASNMASQTVKVILKNHGESPVTVELYPSSMCNIASSGWITVPAGETITTNFIALIGFHNPWWGFSVREYAGDKAATLDMVVAYADAYPSGDRMTSVVSGTKLVNLQNIGSNAGYWDRAGDSKVSLSVDNTRGYTQGASYEHYAMLPMLQSSQLVNVPAYDPEDPYLTVYVKFTNRAANDHAYKYAFGLGTDEDPWDANKKWVKPNTTTLEFTVSDYGQTVLLALRVPRKSNEEKYYFSLIKTDYDTPDGARPDIAKPYYGMNFAYVLTYNNGIGFEAGLDTGVGFGETDPKVNSVAIEYDGALVGEEFDVDIEERTLALKAVIDKQDGATGVVEFTSSNTTVATVTNDGVVRLVGVGDATITVSYGGVSACTVMHVGGIAEVREIRLKHDGKYIDQALSAFTTDGTLALEAVIDMDGGAEGTLEFTSSDEAVATVTNDGTVTLVGAGDTTITASFGDKSCSFTLTVKQPQVHSITVEINGTPVGGTYTADIADEPFKLDVTVEKDEPVTGTLEFDSSDKSVATVSADGVVAVKGVGESVITISFAGKTFTTTLRVIDKTSVTKYQVTVENGEASVSEAAAGETVTLTAKVVAHKTVEKWTYTGFDGELEWINVNAFVMPDSSIHLSPVYKDVLYTVRVVGGSVASAQNADGSAIEFTGKPDGYEDEESRAPETAITLYEFPYGTKLTLQAGAAPAGKMLVGWDVNAVNNRNNAETLSLDMPGTAVKVWAVYSTIHNKDIFEGNTYMDGYNNYVKIDGTLENAEPQFLGYSGFSVEVPKTVTVAATGYDECIRHPLDFTASKTNPQAVKVIVRNRGEADITIELGPKNGGTFCASGWINVPAGETVYHNFIAMEDMGKSWWFFNIREFDGSADVTLDVVAAYADAYPSGMSVVADGAQFVNIQLIGDKPGYWGRTGDPLTFNADNANGTTQAIEYEHFKVLPALYSTELINLPAYDENDPYLTVYVRFVNRSSSGHTFKYALGLGTDENPWDDANKRVRENTKTVEFTVSQPCETVALALRVPRTSATQKYWFCFYKPCYDTEDNTQPSADTPQYDMNFIYTLTYNNCLGFVEGIDNSVGFTEEVAE